MSASSALLDTLASYVPARIVRRIADDPTLPTEPVAEHFLARPTRFWKPRRSWFDSVCVHTHVAIALRQAYNQV